MKNFEFKNILLILFYIIMILLCACITPLLLMLLWNWLIPIFWINAPILNFWQSFGIVILLGLIGQIISRQTK